ncbi:putative FHY3/FAR1 family protein [Helianthus annuus]|nr:putative FHY3/FAR1 family protein [Helianthus annuus]
MSPHVILLFLSFWLCQRWSMEFYRLVHISKVSSKLLGNFYIHRVKIEVWFKNLENDVTVQCSYLRFEQYGLLCKRIYFLFKMFGVKEIPSKYVMKRWTKDVVPNELNVKYNLMVGDKDVQNKAKWIAREIIHTGEYLASNLISDLDQLVLVRDQMRQLKERVDQSRITKQLDPKFGRFSKLIGYQQPVTNAPPTVRVSAGIRNKGRGSHKRIKSKKEQMISRKGKRSRTSSVCNEKGHDIRTCEILKGKQQKKMKGVQIEKRSQRQRQRGRRR